MSKLLARLTLFASAWKPLPLYGHALIVAAALAFLFWLIEKRKTQTPFLLALPAFLTLNAFICTIIICVTHQVNLTTCGISAMLSLLGILPLLDVFSKESLLAGISTSRIFIVELLGLAIFYLLSVDHNYVPAQYDITTYSFIGEQLFRKGAYPTVPFAGGSLSTLVPPGYFGVDFLGRIFWNDPRMILLLSCVFLVALTIAFAAVGVLFFEDARIVPFIGAAVFTRGLLWSYWEFNMLRHLSVICALMFLATAILGFRSKNTRQAFLYFLYAQTCLGAALVAHPENTAYVLVAVFAYAAVRVSYFLSEENRVRTLMFAVAGVLSIGVFAVWYLTSVAHQASGGVVFSASKLPVPVLKNLLFHTNGIIPIVAIAVACTALAGTGKKEQAKFLTFSFLLLIAASYYAVALHALFRSKFPMEAVPFDDFLGASHMVMGPMLHPYSLLIKISGFWWLGVLATAWMLQRLWENPRIPRTVLMAGIAGAMTMDVLYMYYNKPILTSDEYVFLQDLKPQLPKNTVVVAPPGYEFSAWTGPVLEKDSVSFRGSLHTRNTLSKDLETEVEKAYASGDFQFFENKLAGRPVVYLFTKSYANLADKRAAKNGMRVLSQLNGDTAVANF